MRHYTRLIVEFVKSQKDFIESRNSPITGYPNKDILNAIAELAEDIEALMPQVDLQITKRLQHHEHYCEGCK